MTEVNPVAWMDDGTSSSHPTSTRVFTGEAKTERKKWDLKQVHDECMLDLWRHGGRNMLTGEKLERLPPRLWEQFRVDLQNLYRRATGEEFAVLTVENNP